MKDQYKFILEKKKSRLSTKLSVAKYKNPLATSPISPTNLYVSSEDKSRIAGNPLLFTSTTPTQIDIYISIFNNGDIFSFGIEAWNQGIDAIGTVDWGLGQGPETWTAPWNDGDEIVFSSTYDEGDYHIILTFDNQEQVAKLELDSDELGSTRCITSITGLQVLQNPYQIDIDTNLLNSFLDLGNIPSLTECWALDNQLTGLNLQGSTGLTNIQFFDNQLSTLDISGLVNLVDILLENNQLTQQAVDSILITLDQNGLTNGYINIGGTGNAAPSSIGIAAQNSLIGKGWTIN